MKNYLTPLVLILVVFSCKKTEDAQLQNNWQVDSFVESSISLVQSAPGGIYMNFGSTQKVDFTLEKNTCQSSFESTGKDISITSPVCTKVCCDSDFSVKLIQLMDSVKTYEISEETLYLRGNDDLKIKLNLVK